MFISILIISVIGIAQAIPFSSLHRYNLPYGLSGPVRTNSIGSPLSPVFSLAQLSGQQRPVSSPRTALNSRYTYPIFDIHSSAPLTERINSYNTELYRAATVGSRVGQIESRFLQNIDYANNFQPENDQLGVNIIPGIPAVLYSSVAPPGVRYIYGYDSEVQPQGAEDGPLVGRPLFDTASQFLRPQNIVQSLQNALRNPLTSSSSDDNQIASSHIGPGSGHGFPPINKPKPDHKGSWFKGFTKYWTWGVGKQKYDYQPRQTGGPYYATDIQYIVE